MQGPSRNTLLLDRTTWGLCVDAAGNIAMASAPYALAQDVSSACRLFLGELWYDARKGVPWFQRILGKSPSRAYVQTKLEAAALTVSGVTAAKATITGVARRRMTGIITITDANGRTSLANF